MEKKPVWCPFINGECRKDCAYYEVGYECGLKRLLNDLLCGLMNDR